MSVRINRCEDRARVPDYGSGADAITEGFCVQAGGRRPCSSGGGGRSQQPRGRAPPEDGKGKGGTLLRGLWEEHSPCTLTIARRDLRQASSHRNKFVF